MPMSHVAFVILALAIIATIYAAPSCNRRAPGPTWFDILPTLTESRKRRTRAQQTHRHGTRRYGA